MTREQRRTNRRGRRSGTPQVSTIYWRDIPAQLTARTDQGQHKVLLHARFQHAIDRAAGVAGLTATDDYVNEWRTETAPLPDGDDVDATLAGLCATMEKQFPRRRLEALVRSGGLEPPTDETSREGVAPTLTDDPPAIQPMSAGEDGLHEISSDPNARQQEQP